MLGSFESNHIVPKSNKETWHPPQNPPKSKQKDALKKQSVLKGCTTAVGKHLNQNLAGQDMLSLFPKVAIKCQTPWFGRTNLFLFFKYDLFIEKHQNRLRKHEVYLLPQMRQIAVLKSCRRKAKSVTCTTWQDPWSKKVGFCPPHRSSLCEVPL